jgi:hypothetical protein
MTTERITELLNIIESRQSHYAELRAIAGGALPSLWSDWQHYEPAGSIASDIVAVLEASLIGRVDLRVDPDDPTADQLISILYNRHLHPLVRESSQRLHHLRLGRSNNDPMGTSSAQARTCRRGALLVSAPVRAGCQGGSAAVW